MGAAVTSSYTIDPLTLAAKRAVDAGIVVVTAAGNLGRNAAGDPQYGGITAPGNAPWVLTVGASSHEGTANRHDDVVAAYSSLGPSAIDYTAKPDITAPGTGIVSLSDPASAFYQSKSDFLVNGSFPTGYKPYLSLTGTSMAAPVVSGTVALMLQANPSLTPNLVKAVLQYTARAQSGVDPLAQGAGFVNARGAVTLAGYFAAAAPGSRYPHDLFVEHAHSLGQPADYRRRHQPDGDGVGDGRRLGRGPRRRRGQHRLGHALRDPLPQHRLGHRRQRG